MRSARASTETAAVRRVLIAAAAGVVGLLLVVPLAALFAQAFSKGAAAYLAALGDDKAREAVRMTLGVAAIVVSVNTVFGVAAAWAIARFRFPGKSLLVTLLDLPFAVSPVVVGLIFVLLFGAQGALGPWLAERGVKIIFAMPGLVLVTLFVTFPIVARELIPLMQSQGAEEEEAARALGAGGWRMFWSVTFPNIRWALLYGVILCNARAMGEFCAVSIVSGHIRGRTVTIPLEVENLYNEYQAAAAFSLASLLALLALATMAVKVMVERNEESAS